MENSRENELAGGSGVHIQATNLEDNQSVSDTEVIESIADNTDLNDQEVALDDEQEEGQNLRHYMLAKDRVRREIKPPPKYTHVDVIAYALTIGDSIEMSEHVSFQEACNSKQKDKWFKAMKEEMTSLNNTWTLVRRPTDQKVIGCRWIYKKKPDIPGLETIRFKARVVAKGYSQV